VEQYNRETDEMSDYETSLKPEMSCHNLIIVAYIEGETARLY